MNKVKVKHAGMCRWLDQGGQGVRLERSEGFVLCVCTRQERHLSP